MPEPRPRTLVTGASGGVGAAVARALGLTHDLLVGGRDPNALAALAAELPAASPWVVDLADDAAVAEATAGIDRLDALVHCAGAWAPGEVGDTGAADWRRLFELNVVAVAELTRRLLPALRAAGGRVVLVNSTAGRRVGAGRGAYAATKFALRALGDALHAEEGPRGVRVTTIFLGRVATPMQRQVRRAEGGPFEAARYLDPAVVGEAVRWVLSVPPAVEVAELVLLPAPVPGDQV